MRTVFYPIECVRRDILGALIDRLEVVDDAHRWPPFGACAAHVPLGVDDNASFKNEVGAVTAGR
jgi:hypothetical protein